MPTAARASIEVRLATPDDLEAIVAVHVESWQSAYKSVIPQSRLGEGTPAMFRARWEPCLVAPETTQTCPLVATMDDVVVGIGRLVFADAPSEAEVSYVYVHSDAQMQGIGTMLLDRMMAIAVSKDMHTLSLWVVERHQSARAFWEHKGWFVTGASRHMSGSGWQLCEVQYGKTL